jgi:hypothetical protein
MDVTCVCEVERGGTRVPRSTALCKHLSYSAVTAARTGLARVMITDGQADDVGRYCIHPGISKNARKARRTTIISL